MFKVNAAPKKLIEALKKDPSRVESYTWQSLYRDVHEAGDFWDRRYLKKEKAKITTEHYVTKISILELTGGDMVKDIIPKMGQTPSNLYQNIATASQAQYNAAQQQYSAAQAHNIYSNATQGLI